MTKPNETCSYLALGCLLGLFTYLLVTVPLYQPYLYKNPVQQKYGN